MEDATHHLATESNTRAVLLRALARMANIPISDARAEFAAIALFIPLTLSTALWNGFPLIFYDTGAYLLEGLGRVFLAERSPVYSLFLGYAGARASLWFVAIVQAAITSFVVVETARAIAPRLRLLVLILVGVALVTLTGLPWYVGQVEPDCFTAVTILSIYLLAFQARAIAGWRAWALMAIAGLAIAVHPSHVLLGGALLAGVIVYRLVVWAKGQAGWPDAHWLEPLASCALGLCMILAANYDLTHKIFVSRAGPSFIFARLLQDGIVMRLLDDTCPRSHYKLCAYKDELPRTADQWLWNTNSPFYAMDKYSGTRAESSRIIWDSLKRYPLEHLVAAFFDSVHQFALFRTGDQIEPQQWVLSAPLKQFISGQMDAYLAARQQKGEIDFRPINAIDVPVAWLGLFGLIVALVFAIRGRREAATMFLGFVLLALICNAVICATFSNPHARYQSRVVWLAPFALLLLAGDRANFALRGVSESGS